MLALLALPLPVSGAGLCIFGQPCCFLVVAVSLGPASVSLCRWALGLLALSLPGFDAAGCASWCVSALGVASRMLWPTPLTRDRYFTRIGQKSLPCEKSLFLFLILTLGH